MKRVQRRTSKAMRKGDCEVLNTLAFTQRILYDLADAQALEKDTRNFKE
jgi:hypothetical protein